MKHFLTFPHPQASSIGCRAAMAILRQQAVFVEHLAETGMLSKRESELMEVPIGRRIRRLAHAGPVWRAPLIAEVLHSMPIMREVLLRVTVKTFPLDLFEFD